MVLPNPVHSPPCLPPPPYFKHVLLQDYIDRPEPGRPHRERRGHQDVRPAWLAGGHQSDCGAHVQCGKSLGERGKEMMGREREISKKEQPDIASQPTSPHSKLAHAPHPLRPLSLPSPLDRARCPPRHALDQGRVRHGLDHFLRHHRDACLRRPPPGRPDQGKRQNEKWGRGKE